MSYMWNDFNIKTFPAETIVFRDGVFCAELSTLQDCDINKNYKLPIHLIYIGEITDNNNLNININVNNQKVFLSVNVKNKKPAFLNIFIKNTGKNSEIKGQVMLNNFSELEYNCIAEHKESDNGILIKTKIIGEKDSFSKLSGTALIYKNCVNVISDISFAAQLDESAKIQFSPAQKISAIPKNADHSASIYSATDAQCDFLRSAGLSGAEVKNAVREAFINDFLLF